MITLAVLFIYLFFHRFVEFHLSLIKLIVIALIFYSFSLSIFDHLSFSAFRTHLLRSNSKLSVLLFFFTSPNDRQQLP